MQMHCTTEKLDNAERYTYVVPVSVVIYTIDLHKTLLRGYHKWATISEDAITINKI